MTTVFIVTVEEDIEEENCESILNALVDELAKRDFTIFDSDFYHE